MSRKIVWLPFFQLHYEMNNELILKETQAGD